jgi:DtxR family Mn-dependent transcriptional regulator
VAHPHSVTDYLETIYFLAFPVGEYGPVVRDSPALAARVAEMLGVSRASAGEMLKRLEADGLIERGERKEALLTEAGREAAERVVRRHRLIERFLTDFMGYTPAESHEQADELGDTFSDDMIERMARKLGDPVRCPHGWPVDPALEQDENRQLVALSDVEEGSRATIVRLAEHDGSLLHWFFQHGLVPGAEVELESVQRSAGQLTVRVDGGERTMSASAGAGLFVRPAGPDPLAPTRRPPGRSRPGR